jgi:gluconolactonase
MDSPQELVRGFGLIEGPVWDPERGLIFSDVLEGGIYRLDDAGGYSTVFEHRRGVGGMALHVDGGLIVSGRNISYKPFDGGDTVLVLDRDVDAGNVGYNDLTTDEAGRVYAGSLGSSPVFEDGREPQAGELYLIDLDGSARVVARDIQLTNGLGFSPDGRTLYHSDSNRQTVFQYSVEADGSLGEKRPFATTDTGVPDGLAVAVDGSVWVALAGGGGVGVFDASGRQSEFVAIPDGMCTSVCFGGEGLEDLYIVSGSRGAPSDRHGAVYVTRAGVAGLPVAPAGISLG